MIEATLAQLEPRYPGLTADFMKLYRPKKVQTEDLGKTLEYALCLALDTPFDGTYRYSVEEAQKLKDRLLPVKERFAGYVHTGKHSNLYDFQSPAGGHLSVKSNKNGWKVCPQIIGQTTNKKFREAFALDASVNIKAFIQENTERLLNEYAAKTFHSPVLYYNQKAKYFGIVQQVAPIQWGTLTFSKTGDTWNESSTLKSSVNGKTKTIGEFQIHAHRDAIKFRFDFKSLLELYPESIQCERF